MLSKLIEFSLKSKFFIILLVSGIVGFGLYALTQIPIGAVPDITNNQVQVITTSRNLSTTDVEQFITYPVELEMVNLPGVKEIRSVSKFGLSVVTIVFEDDLGTYLPRQLIAEKLKSAAEKIPSGFGTPQMGPITTGLGEIYQYTLETKPGYEDDYDATELRTIQDWIVRRQLSGIPGVVEINTWGGYLKEYEVSINSKRLQANDISVSEVFQALESNNSIAGGSYIEKNEEAYFIRGEGLLKSLEEIENISVSMRGNQPVYIRDIAEVGYGYARRFGAITGNGEGEKVLGQVMMLKDADSKKVIDAVKVRISEIEKSLPEGVYINGFLDRSELIQRTTSTIAENLLLGFLVVSLIVILLIGDWRSGLIIASIIPLSFLCAISLMYVFGIDANLMSLGALDFGIIIDGAVIIVEFVAFKLWQRSNEFSEKSFSEISKLKDQVTLNGASKMLNSAIFGQLIILIVFIPILSLSGVEGKMFRPMALTFSFALIGAMVLCFTWVPVACSLILKPKPDSTSNISTKLINGAKRLYLPSIKWALRHTKTVVASALLLLILGVFTFFKMGGEFVPTLDEGDFVIQPVLKTGKSLKSTIERTTAIEEVLLEFPEVSQVVSRIGAAEVPTDPMSMQDSDVIVRLKPKSEWTPGTTKEDLAEQFSEALAVFPGMDLEFTQPIEMRFNELITGVRSDIAIKVFGEDLDILARKGKQIREMIESVEGAADITVEKIVGLPQMLVNYRRDKIARYGLDIKSINEVIAAGFAGKSTGVVFEGEKRFDLVVRLQESQRQNINDLRNLRIDTPNAGKIPLAEVADISFDKGPAKISRDQSKRRIVVGVNVRNRDLESVVTDIQDILDDNLDLPVGYTMTYGGQFENLESAKARLKIAVPIALVLIYIMLFFALRTHKDALLIFTAIPFSAVGGVFLLWLRDMPFSISAGVGFIALFGIAVLNGIILVEYFKDIRETHNNQLSFQHIVDATQDRLRAVLLTASSTALGFLPMAISTGAGAEVQRPLATVVIGGLFTSTLLTLIILPVLYRLKNKKIDKKLNPKLGIFLILCCSVGFSAQGQDQEFESLKQQMLNNNKQLKSAQLQTESVEAAEGEAFTFNKTQVYQNYDESELDPIANQPFYQWGVIQQFDFPTVYGSRLKLNKVKTKLASTQYSIIELKKIKALQISYQNYLVATSKLSIYDSIFKIYSDFSRMAERKFEEGESNYLEKITAESKANQIKIEQDQLQQELTNSLLAMKALLQSEDSLILNGKTLYQLQLNKPVSAAENLSLSAMELDQQLAKRSSSLAKNELLPGISASYFQRSNSSIDKNFNGYQVGLNIPLLFFGDRSKIKAATIQEKAKEAALEDAKISLKQEQSQLINRLTVQQKALETYQENQLQMANELLKAAKLSYKAGEIDFFRYVQTLEQAQRIQLDYLTKLREYNQTIIDLNYFLLN